MQTEDGVTNPKSVLKPCTHIGKNEPFFLNSCGHSFCGACLRSAPSVSSLCPFCLKRIETKVENFPMASRNPPEKEERTPNQASFCNECFAVFPSPDQEKRHQCYLSVCPYTEFGVSCSKYNIPPKDKQSHLEEKGKFHLLQFYSILQASLESEIKGKLKGNLANLEKKVPNCFRTMVKDLKDMNNKNHSELNESRKRFEKKCAEILPVFDRLTGEKASQEEKVERVVFRGGTHEIVPQMEDKKVYNFIVNNVDEYVNLGLFKDNVAVLSFSFNSDPDYEDKSTMIFQGSPLETELSLDLDSRRLLMVCKGGNRMKSMELAILAKTNLNEHKLKLQVSEGKGEVVYCQYL